MSAGLVVFVSGLVLLVIASCIKIHQIHDAIGEALHSRKANISLASPNDIANSSYTVFLDDIDLFNDTVVRDMGYADGIIKSDEEEEGSSTVCIIAMSILGFMGLDMGFDLTIALSRASILDVVPKFQHKQVLVLATIVQSVAGFICATIGCFDLPGVLGAFFNTDGSAATLIFFCCVLLTTSFLSFSLMGLANYRLSKKTRKLSPGSISDMALPEPSKNYEKGSMVQAAFEPLEEMGSLSVNGPASRLRNLHDNQMFASSSIGNSKSDAYTKPLLLDRLKTNYSTISTDMPPGRVGEFVDSNSNHKLETSCLEIQKVLESFPDILPSPTESENLTKPLLSKADMMNEEQEIAEGGDDVSGVLEAISQPSTVAITPLEALNVAGVVETEHAIPEEQDLPKLGSAESEHRYRKMKLKLLILCVSCFFSVGSSLTFSLYSFNALNLGIMNGDPSALPGSEGRRNYEDGLKLGSFGNMVFYSAFLLISLTNTRVLRLLGEKCQYVMNHVILIVGLVAVMASQRIDVFMVYMGCCGLFRPCMLTLPYVMAHQFAQEGMPTEKEESGQKRSHTGRVMTLIGFMVPSHYCLLSILMGPLMEATGNPWVPLFYCLGTCTVSLGVFSLLFFV
ncbi:solute carrier family 45 member 3 [Elysia marginata]|uniref:Solute carrier family 45 member 3 n=1 Tax=Elysia marginata TaxID=1093978 RepID=A0AAV4IHC0_9GAST|nr:solute carrier family 45 member 3 [Elysia marginata]